MVVGCTVAVVGCTVTEARRSRGGGGEDSYGGGTRDRHNQCGDRHSGEDSWSGGIRGDGEGASYGGSIQTTWEWIDC